MRDTEDKRNQTFLAIAVADDHGVGRLARLVAELPDALDRLSATVMLIPHLPSSNQSRYVDVAFKLASQLYRIRQGSFRYVGGLNIELTRRFAEALIQLLNYAPSVRRAALFKRVLSVTTTFKNSERTQLLVRAIPHLSDKSLEAWADSLLVQVEHWPEVGALLPHLKPPKQKQLFVKAVTSALNINDIYEQADRLHEICELLILTGAARDVLEIILKPGDLAYLAHAVGALASCLLGRVSSECDQSLKDAVNRAPVSGVTEEERFAKRIEAFADISAFVGIDRAKKILALALAALNTQKSTRDTSAKRGVEIGGPPSVSPRAFRSLGLALKDLDGASDARKGATESARLYTHMESKIEALLYVASFVEWPESRKLFTEALELAGLWSSFGYTVYVDELLVRSAIRYSRAGLFQESLILLQNVQFDHLKADGLEAVLHDVPVDLVSRVIVSTGSLSLLESRATIIREIARRIPKFGISSTHQIFSEVITASSHLGWTTLLEDMVSLAQVMIGLGGEDIGRPVDRTLRLVKRWSRQRYRQENNSEVTVARRARSVRRSSLITHPTTTVESDVSD